MNRILWITITPLSFAAFVAPSRAATITYSPNEITIFESTFSTRVLPTYSEGDGRYSTRRGNSGTGSGTEVITDLRIESAPPGGGWFLVLRTWRLDTRGRDRIAGVDVSFDARELSIEAGPVEVGFAFEQPRLLIAEPFLLTQRLSVRVSSEDLGPGDFGPPTVGEFAAELSADPYFGEPLDAIVVGVYHLIRSPDGEPTRGVVGMDNVRITVRFVPEPNTVALLLLSAGATAGRSRRVGRRLV